MDAESLRETKALAAKVGLPWFRFQFHARPKPGEKRGVVYDMAGPISDEDLQRVFKILLAPEPGARLETRTPATGAPL